MFPQWPWVVWDTKLWVPSNGEAIAKEQMEAAARATAQIRLPIVGILAFDFAARTSIAAVARSHSQNFFPGLIISGPERDFRKPGTPK